MVQVRRLLVTCAIVGVAIAAYPVGGAVATSPDPVEAPDIDVGSILPDLGAVLDDTGTRPSASCEEACKARLHQSK